MKADLQIGCTCGRFQGVARAISGSAGNRLVCYCDDCQAFAEFLGRADEILDAHGGTDVFQMSAAHLEIVDGAESLSCMRLTPNGLLRWYANCCKTPIGNTLPTHQLPFVGLIHLCMSINKQSLDEVIGPVRAGVHRRFARGDRAAIGAHDRVSLYMLARMLRKLIWWRLKGDHKRTPFFDETGTPAVEPRVGEC